MKYLTAGLLLVGLVLLGVIVYQTDLAEVQHWLGELGRWGALAILGVSLLALLSDSLTWQLTLPAIPWSLNWFYRLTAVMLVGEAFNKSPPWPRWEASRSRPWC